MSDLQVDMRGWPASLVEIAEVITPAGALRLVHHFGGLQIYVPATVPPMHVLATALGLDTARLLCERYAGEQVNVPTLFAARSKKALIARAAGSTKAVARNLGVTEQWVRSCRRELRPSPTQIGMFDDPETE